MIPFSATFVHRGELERLLSGGYTARYTEYMTAWGEALGTLVGILQEGGMDEQSLGAITAAVEAMSGARNNIEQLRQEFIGNGALELLASTDEQMAQIINAALALDSWCPGIDIEIPPDALTNPDALQEIIQRLQESVQNLQENAQALATTVGTALGACEMAAGQMLSPQVCELLEQYEGMQTSLTALTNGLGYEGYVAQINAVLASQNVTDLSKAIEDINAGLVAIEKGQMTAAIEFANGKATISMGEYQLQVAESHGAGIRDRRQLFRRGILIQAAVRKEKRAFVPLILELSVHLGKL